MSDFLKGNFKTKQKVQKRQKDKAAQLNEEFEKTALRRLGGSIAFTSQKGFLWKGGSSERGKPGSKSK